MSEANLKMQYLEATRLHLWYRGSKFSFFQGKASNELAVRYKNLAINLYHEYLLNKNK